jgi:hypothetical protein
MNKARKLRHKDAAAYLKSRYGIGSIEGGLGGAQSEREVREEIEKIPLDTLRQSEAFKALTAQGVSEDAARQARAKDLGTRAFVTGGLATGLFGGMGDRVIAKTFLNSLGKQGWKSIAAKLSKSAVGEGLFEEAPQSALQQVAQNEAVQKVDPNKSLADDVANQGIGGLVTGGVMGVGMGVGMGGAFHGATREQAPAPATTEPPEQLPYHLGSAWRIRRRSAGVRWRRRSARWTGSRVDRATGKGCAQALR